MLEDYINARDLICFQIICDISDISDMTHCIEYKLEKLAIIPSFSP